MTDTGAGAIRRGIDMVSTAERAYLILYRLSREGAHAATYETRYNNLLELLRTYSRPKWRGEGLADHGHISTSAWIIYEHGSPSGVAEAVNDIMGSADQVRVIPLALAEMAAQPESLLSEHL